MSNSSHDPWSINKASEEPNAVKSSSQFPTLAWVDVFTKEVILIDHAAVLLSECTGGQEMLHPHGSRISHQDIAS